MTARLPRTVADASPPPSSSPVIGLEGVSKVFELNERAFTAVEEISFAVDDGQFCSIIGPSGCGKSTLLRLIAGILPPSAGTITVYGGSASEARKARKFGFVFQEPVLLPWRSTLENVELPLVVARVRPQAERKRRAGELLELVGLSGFESAPPSKLSGGMASRVGIARALVLEPEILLLDEPFGALDEITRQRMNAELQRIWTDSRTTAILVTHNVGEAVYMSDRVLVMGTRPGRIIADRPIDLPRPRTLNLLQEPDFFEHTRTLSRLLLTSTEGQDEG